jgi:hypothetical protein
MTEEQESEGTRETDTTNQRKPFRVRLPGFVSGVDVGMGDVVKRATSYLGIQACGGCERRAAALNRWITFTGRQPR